MSSNDSQNTKIRMLGSLLNSINEQLPKLIVQNEELENNLSYLAVMVQEDQQLSERLKEELMGLQSSLRRLRDLKRVIYIAAHIQTLLDIGSRQDESLAQSLSPPLPPSGVPFKFPP